MSYSKSLRSYADVKEIFDKAVDMGGAAVVCRTAGQAINLRARLNHFRQLDRDSMAEIYPAEHPNHGVSIYDPFVVRILDNTLTVEPRETGDYTIGPLPPKPETLTPEK